MTDQPLTLGSLIRSRRIELGLTQEELAERVGDSVRQAEISRLERDCVGLPRRARLERIAAALKLKLGELLARSGWAGVDSTFQAQSMPAPGIDVTPDQHSVSRHEIPRSHISTDLVCAIEQARETTKRTESLLALSLQTYDRVCRSISRVSGH
jgi:transcriptional regulator with XRE-family HTH domain